MKHAMLIVWLAASSILMAASPVLELEGLKASREDSSVTVDVRMTGIGPHDPIEFILLGHLSGHDYEALAYTKVPASDIRRGLEFIGMEAGRPVSYAETAFWPKGERVMVSVSWTDEHGDEMIQPAEKLLRDPRTDEPPLRKGFTFTGSYTQRNSEGRAFLVADEYEPYSIISVFNLGATLLDAPGRADQSAVYGSTYAALDNTFTNKQPAKIILRPEYTDGRTRVKDLTWKIKPKGDGPATNLTQVASVLLDEKGRRLNERDALASSLSVFAEITEAGGTPYVTLDFHSNLALSVMQQFGQFVQSVEGNEGIRVEPPLPEQLYYKAFLPNPEWRDAKRRFGQPLELLLFNAIGDDPHKVRRITETWPAQGLEPRLRIETRGVADADEFHEMARKLKGDLNILMVFAPDHTPYRTISEYIEPLKEVYRTVYIFNGLPEDLRND